MRHWTLQEALVYGKGTERPFLCPVHGDSRPSASVNVIKKKWYCYSCGARGGLTGEDLLIEPDYEVMKAWYEKLLEEHRVYPESWLSRWDAGPTHPYWVARVGEPAAVAFRLGYDSDRNAVTYPLRDASGQVLGVVRRALDEGGPKYRYPPGIDVGRLLFNYTPEHRRTVVLVEGALDAIALWNVGVDAFAIYGSRLGPVQVNLIDRVDPDVVYTCFDMDDAGWRAHCMVKDAFKHRQVRRFKWPLSWGKDIDEVGEEKRKKIVSVLAPEGQSNIDSTTCRSRGSASTRTLRIQRSATTSLPSRLSIRRSVT